MSVVGVSAANVVMFSENKRAKTHKIIVIHCHVIFEEEIFVARVGKVIEKNKCKNEG